MRTRKPSGTPSDGQTSILGLKSGRKFLGARQVEQLALRHLQTFSQMFNQMSPGHVAQEILISIFSSEAVDLKPLHM